MSEINKKTETTRSPDAVPEPGGAPAGPDMPAYAFHEPAFVTWWLGSLYLLKPEDQIAIAAGLFEVIHEPGVKAELAAYIALRGMSEEVPQAEPVVAGVPVFEGTRTEQAIQAIKYHLRLQWENNPWIVGIAGAGFVFVVGKGAWFILKELYRLVF